MYEIINTISIKTTGHCNFQCKYCYNTMKQKQIGCFEDFDGLYTFLSNAKLTNPFRITITGGEFTLAIPTVLKIRKIANRIEREKNIKIKLSAISNGSNVDKVLELLQNKIIDPEYFHISWDGKGTSDRIHNKEILSDKYYENVFKTYAKHGYNIHTSFALTESNIHNLSNSFKELISYGITKFGYYLIGQYNYSNEDFLAEYKNQLIDFMNYYSSLSGDYHFDNYRYFLESKHTKYNHTCPKLGKFISVNQFGNIYPCAWYLEHNLFKLGTLKSGISKEAIAKFQQEYDKPYECDYKECKNKQCFICPCGNYVNRGGMNKPNLTTCKFYDVEREIFSKYNISEDTYFEETQDYDCLPAFMKD